MVFNTATLDNQIAKLTAERDRQTKLNDRANQALASLADILNELHGDEDAIATLKTETMRLFHRDEEREILAEQEIEASTDSKDEEPETISDRVQQAKSNYFTLTPTDNPAVAYLKRRDGQLGCLYLGGMSQARLTAWGDWLHANGYVTTPVTPRSAKRLSNWSYELKLPPMPLSYLHDLIGTNYTRYPSMPRFTHSVLAA